jgi:hypothetical protein
LEYLINQRAAILAQGSLTKNFVKVDASQPIEKVYAEVIKHTMKWTPKTGPAYKVESKPS